MDNIVAIQSHFELDKDRMNENFRLHIQIEWLKEKDAKYCDG